MANLKKPRTPGFDDWTKKSIGGLVTEKPHLMREKTVMVMVKVIGEDNGNGKVNGTGDGNRQG